jgi:hypothetical protein
VLARLRTTIQPHPCVRGSVHPIIALTVGLTTRMVLRSPHRRCFSYGSGLASVQHGGALVISSAVSRYVPGG